MSMKTTLKTSNFLSLVTGICIGLFGSHAAADATIQISTDQQPVTVFVKNQKVLFRAGDARAREQSEAVFDQTTQTLNIIDHQNRTLFPLNEKTVRQLGGTINAAVGAMQQQLEGMSPEQRAQMETMMSGLGLSVPKQDTRPAVTLSRVAEKSYSGIRCEESAVMQGKKKLASVCISSGNTTPLSDTDYGSLLAAQAFMLDMARQVKQFAKQYGQQIPNLGDIELSGLMVNSVQTEQTNSSGNRFSIDTITTGNVAEITVPTDYQVRTLLQ